MGVLVKAIDFQTGEFLITESGAESEVLELEAIIDRIEVEVLQDLMGSALYTAFVADLDSEDPATPETQRFIDIFDAFFIDDVCRLRSEGMVSMLKMFIWFEYTRTLSAAVSPVGHIAPVFENTTPVSQGASGMEKTYNRGIRSYRAILDFIILDSATYPEFDGKGINKEFISFI